MGVFFGMKNLFISVTLHCSINYRMCSRVLVLQKTLYLKKSPLFGYLQSQDVPDTVEVHLLGRYVERVVQVTLYESVSRQMVALRCVDSPAWQGNICFEA